jgi:hypothetical protein
MRHGAQIRCIPDASVAFSQVNDLGGNLFPYIQKANAFPSTSSHPPESPGIEKQDSLPLRLRGEMGVAVDDTLNPGKFPPDPFFDPFRPSPPVDESNPKFSRLNRPFFGKLLANWGSVHIAPNGQYFFFSKNFQDRQFGNVSGVKNLFDFLERPAKQIFQLRSRLAKMGIGEYAKLHRSLFSFSRFAGMKSPTGPEAFAALVCSPISWPEPATFCGHAERRIFVWRFQRTGIGVQLTELFCFIFC